MPPWAPTIAQPDGLLLLQQETPSDGSCARSPPPPPPLPPKSATELLLLRGAARHRHEEEQHTHGRGRQRFLPELKGGDVPRLALSDRRARDLIGRGLPVVLTGGAVLGTDTPAGGWTAEKLLRHLTGTSQVAVVAPACTDRRFTYFNAEAHLGDYGTVPARSVTKQHVKVDATLAQSMQQQQQHDIEETGTASTTSTTTATVPYLQIRVFHAHAGGFGASELPAPLMRELQPSINERALRDIQTLGRFGPLVLSQCFVSPTDALSPCHFDEQHNVYVQLSGRKSFLLFAPDHATPHLVPFPKHHCADRRARTDIEGSAASSASLGALPCGGDSGWGWGLGLWGGDRDGPSTGADKAGHAALEGLRGSGVEAVLEAGDTLVLPAMWWHHVHALGAGSVSVSFWMARSSSAGEEAASSKAVVAAAAADHDKAERVSEKVGSAGDEHDDGTFHALRLRLAREAEAVVGEVLGPLNARAFFLRLSWRCKQPWAQASPLDAMEERYEWPVGYPLNHEAWPDDLAQAEADREDTLLIEPLLQDWLLRRLADLLGDAASARAFVTAYLGERRFDGL